MSRKINSEELFKPECWDTIYNRHHNKEDSPFGGLEKIAQFKDETLNISFSPNNKNEAGQTYDKAIELCDSLKKSGIKTAKIGFLSRKKGMPVMVNSVDDFLDRLNQNNKGFSLVIVADYNEVVKRVTTLEDPKEAYLETFKKSKSLAGNKPKNKGTVSYRELVDRSKGDNIIGNSPSPN